MSCRGNLPIDDIIDAVQAGIDITAIGGVPADEFEQKVLAIIQPKIDAINNRITDLPAEKFVVSQVLQGNKLIMTLSDGSTIDTDVSALL